MSNTITPNMQLIVPGVGTEAGPQFATDINNSLTLIDAHTHSSGSGVQITPSGININAALNMNNNILSSASSINLQAQLSAPPSDSLYLSGVDLFFVDGNGNNIRITQSGSVTGSSGTITGLPSGTASASFGAGTFVFQAATNTAAVIDGGSFILRNSTASSNGLTLSPPNAMAADYSLVLPSIPAQTNVMTLDTSGNMGSGTYDSVGQNMTSIGANAIGVSMTSTGANAVAASRTRPVANPASIGGIAVSSGTGSQSTSGTLAGLAVLTMTSSGRPVFITLTAANNAAASSVSTLSVGSGYIAIQRAGLGTINLMQFGGSSGLHITSPGSYSCVDLVGAGTHTYSVALVSNGGTVIGIDNVVLVAYEL